MEVLSSLPGGELIRCHPYLERFTKQTKKVNSYLITLVEKGPLIPVCNGL
jgi:hypothetical protein